MLIQHINDADIGLANTKFQVKKQKLIESYYGLKKTILS